MSYKNVRKIHIYSAFTVIGFLLMYTITGYLITHNKLLPFAEQIPVITEHQLSLPEGTTVEDLPAYIQNKFKLKGHRGKPQSNNNGVITILFYRPGYRHQAIIAADKKSIKINSTKTDIRGTIVLFHRMKEYGGGFIYNLYVLMTDITAVAIIIFSLTGIYLGLYNGKKLFPKLLLLFIGMGYTLLVIFSFMKS